MIFHKGIGMQTSPLTPIQKSLTGVGGDPDGAKVYDSITVVDEISKSEFQMFANKADLRQALLEAEQRGDVRVGPRDIALADSGRIRKSVAALLYPNATFPGDTTVRNDDGVPFKKGADPVKAAYRAFREDPETTSQELQAATDELDALARRMNNG